LGILSLFFEESERNFAYGHHLPICKISLDSSNPPSPFNLTMHVGNILKHFAQIYLYVFIYMLAIAGKHMGGVTSRLNKFWKLLEISWAMLIS